MEWSLVLFLFSWSFVLIIGFFFLILMTNAIMSPHCPHFVRRVFLSLSSTVYLYSFYFCLHSKKTIFWHPFF